MMQALWEDRRQQEAKLAEERRLWEEEKRRREWEFEEERQRRQEDTARREEQTFQQMQVLQALVEGMQLQGETLKKQQTEGGKEVKIAKLTELDGFVSYLTTFERLMTAFEVKRERWAFRLAPSLSGKAQKAYAALSVADASVYDRLY
jgi:site-specific recombinase